MIVGVLGSAGFSRPETLGVKTHPQACRPADNESGALLISPQRADFRFLASDALILYGSGQARRNTG
jgi:hypothetical protein